MVDFVRYHAGQTRLQAAESQLQVSLSRFHAALVMRSDGTDNYRRLLGVLSEVAQLSESVTQSITRMDQEGEA